MRLGAEAGATSRPSLSAPLAGGGGGGTYDAPPPLVAARLRAPRRARATSAHASANAATSSLWLKVEGILFRTPTGLADGLALKELARLLSKVRPEWPTATTLVPPFRVTADSAWRGSYQMFRRLSPPPLVRSHTSSARGAPAPPRGRAGLAAIDAEQGAHASSAISDSAMRQHREVRGQRAGSRSTPCFCSRWSTFLSREEARA